MAEFNRIRITNDGQGLMAKLMSGEGTLEFTKIAVSSTEYKDEELEGLSSLTNVKQTADISKVTRNNKASVQVEGAITNIELTSGYHMQTLGLYAKDEVGGEVLYAVTNASVAGYMPPYNEKTPSGAYFKLVTTIGNADNVNLEVDPAAVATIGDVKELTTLVNESVEVFDAHSASSVVSEAGAHDIRYWRERLEIEAEPGVWVAFKSGTGFKVGNTENFNTEQRAGLKIEITLGDPKDSTIIDENGDAVTLAKWKGTMVRGKLNSYPVDERDGDLIFNNTTRDKYKVDPFAFDGLSNGDKWYFMAFPYTENEIYTIDSSNRSQSNASDKLEREAPVAPSITGLEFDRVTVTGRDVVSLDKVEWFSSPHTFRDLTEETPYAAYAKLEETATYFESPVSEGKTFTTPSDMPGPSVLVAGDMQAGYFGVVPASELFTGTQIATALGITQGTAQFNDVGWLKFAYKGNIIYKSQKPFRHSISWDHIDSKGAVDGTKQITKDGTTFKVRLMEGGNGNASDSTKGPKGSEWNKLMLPIHEKAKDQSWAYKDNVSVPTDDWGVGFTDADLQTHNSHGNGSYQWCQEVHHSNASGRVLRGYDGVSYSSYNTSSSANANLGWSPVLEVVS